MAVYDQELKSRAGYNRASRVVDIFLQYLTALPEISLSCKQEKVLLNKQASYRQGIGGASNQDMFIKQDVLLFRSVQTCAQRKGHSKTG